MKMRTFTPRDYPALAEVFNASLKDEPLSVFQLRTQDKGAQRREYGRFCRYVVEDNGSLVAFATYDQPFYVYKPFTYRITLAVHPAFQGQGIGSTLYAKVMRELVSLGATSVWTSLHTEMNAGQSFFSKQGFQQDQHTCELKLDMSTFDQALHVSALPGYARQGLEIRTLREVRDDKDHQQKLYDLYREIYQGLPVYESNHLRLLDYVDFQRDLLSKRSEAYFIGLYDTLYVGLSYLTFPWNLNHCSVGLTGVRAPYRNSGIARLLKLRSIEYAREQGFSTMGTFNDATNAAILNLNKQLGFTQRRRWVTYRKRLSRGRSIMLVNE